MSEIVSKRVKRPTVKAEDASSKPASKGGSHLTLPQRWEVFNFLSNKKDFNLIEGIHQDAYVVAGKELKKIDGFGKLAKHMNDKFQFSADDQWTANSAQNRYRTLKVNYNQIKKNIDGQSGSGLSQEEFDSGISLDQKLERLFPLYKQWDSLYGDRQNVNPHSVFESSHLPASAPTSELDTIYGSSIADDDSIANDSHNQESAAAGGTNTANSVNNTNTTSSVASDPLPSTLPSTRATIPGNTSQSKKRDFSTLFMEAKEKEHQIKERQMQFEQEMRTKEFEFKERELQQRTSADREKTKSTLMNLWYSQGKSDDEVSASLRARGYDA